MNRPKIGIAHQTVWVGDAIGNDITGAYRLLEQCGYEVSIVCEYAHPDIRAGYRLRPPDDGEGPDMLLFHHSVHWPAGEQLLRAFAGPVVVKYHNITPADYFAPYTDRYRATCMNAREQTARMATRPNIVRWLSDSPFNCAELGELGIPQEKRGVVPPFNRIDRALRDWHRASYPIGGPFVALFVGRRVPNKGHVHLLRTLAAWRELFPESPLRCRMIGSVDPELAGYYEELDALCKALGVEDDAEWIGHVTDEELAGLFRSSHFYLNLSEHEGFCVPVIEAQAFGLPVLTTNSSALGDTVGPAQIAVPVPAAQEDYDLIAGLAHRICTSDALRRDLVNAGLGNAANRFGPQLLEERFIADMEPALRMVEA